MGVKLQIIVEGQTEQLFVQQILIPHLYLKGINSFCHVIPTKTTNKTYRGGVSSFSKIEIEIKRTLQKKTHYITTMFDFYAIPSDTPGTTEAKSVDNSWKKVQIIEDSITHFIDNQRFISYIQLYEFEALLFSNIEIIDEIMSLDNESRKTELSDILSVAGEPENINDNPETAPSKRLESLYPSYRKTLHGALIFNKIPLSHIRAHCPHFNNWITKLETLTPLGELS